MAASFCAMSGPSLGRRFMNEQTVLLRLHFVHGDFPEHYAPIKKPLAMKKCEVANQITYLYLSNMASITGLGNMHGTDHLTTDQGGMESYKPRVMFYL